MAITQGRMMAVIKAGRHYQWAYRQLRDRLLSHNAGPLQRDEDFLHELNSDLVRLFAEDPAHSETLGIEETHFKHVAHKNARNAQRQAQLRNGVQPWENDLTQKVRKTSPRDEDWHRDPIHRPQRDSLAEETAMQKAKIQPKQDRGYTEPSSNRVGPQVQGHATTISTDEYNEITRLSQEYEAEVRRALLASAKPQAPSTAISVEQQLRLEADTVAYAQSHKGDKPYQHKPNFDSSEQEDAAKLLANLQTGKFF